MTITFDLKATKNNPLPDGARFGELITRDRVKLRYAIWPPKASTMTDRRSAGTVCLFQGRTEFIEKYYEVIEELRGRGFWVATLDWRGQGLSQRRFKNRLRGHVNSFRKYQIDLKTFITKVEQECPAPYFALAHSMGGHILFDASANGHAKFFERVVLSSPMLHLAPEMLIGRHLFSKKMPAYGGKVASQRPTRLLTGFLRLLGLGWAFPPGSNGTIDYTFEDNVLTSDETRFAKMVELMEEHPELTIGAPTIAWINAAMKNMRKILRVGFLRRINVPILIIAAGSDTVVSTPAISRLAPYLRTSHYISIRGARHELMFERDELREQFWAGFDAFITSSDYVKATALIMREKS